jgi:peptide deformylase
MAIREIVTLPHPVLRRKAHRVEQFEKSFQTLVDDMVETMRQAPGVGLAANQVGIPNRLVVVEYGNEEDDTAPKKLFVVANPEIYEASADKILGIEACLSVPGLAGDVDRHLSLIVKGMNRQGKPVKIKATGWLARIFQHEIDHLNGVLFTDRAERIWQVSEEEMKAIAD